jgi:autotransporter family porin
VPLAAENNGAYRLALVNANRDNLSARVRRRAYIKGHSEPDDATGREFQPFVEANWLYNSRAFGVSMNYLSEQVADTRNIGEVKVG